jgi:class 3 adenylate cyclase/HAMP domain-containing protein
MSGGDRVSSLLETGPRERVRFPIFAQLVAAVSAIVLLVLSVLIALWVVSQTRSVRREIEGNATTLATAMADAWGNELTDENWNQIRYQIRSAMERNHDFVYFVVSDTRRGDRVIAAGPDDVIGSYVPDLVPAEVTDAALAAEDDPVSTETYLLRDVAIQGDVRAHAGAPIVESAASIELGGHRVGVLRIGVSLRRVSQARRQILRDALSAGAVCLLLGIVVAWLVARQLTAPVRELEKSVSRMAAGDLAHRSSARTSNEIGALGTAVNRMAGALEKSFARLRGTLQSFERFVPRKFLQVIAPEGIENIQVGVRAEHAITILFSDIRGYTTLSESSTPEQMFNLLNEYLPEMGAVIDANGGFIDKYIGDAIMALFDDEHADGALRAAAAMRERLAALNERRAARGDKTFEIGIGLHRGHVIMGTVGFSSKIESTVIGDAVNAASRVEGLTKQYHVHVLATGAVVDALENAKAFPLRVVDAAAKIRGKDEPVRLYTIDAVAEPSDQSR